MDNKVQLADGLFEDARTDINDGVKGLVKIFIDTIFDHFGEKVKDIPPVIKQIRNKPKAEQENSALWSEKLLKKGLGPKGYNGLPDDILISSLHQTGYLDGMYIDYVLAMMALADNGVY